jgi:hypothetical protein
MKKQMMAAMCALAVLAACSETSEELVPEVKGEGVYATIEQPVSVDTKSLAYENGKLVFTWAEGEKVVVFGNKDAASFNSLTSGETSTKLESEGFTLKDNVNYYACLPAYTIPAATQSTSVPVTFMGQRQTANGNSDHLKSFDYACASATKAEGKNTISFELKNQVAWIVLDHTFTDATNNVTSVTINADEDLFVTKGTLDVTTSTITEGTKDRKITLNLGEEGGNGLSFAAGETFRGFFTLNPVDLSGKTLTFTATTKSGETVALGTFTKASANLTKNLAVRIQTSGSAKVATVDGKEYSTLSAALAAASEGATISVVSDVTTEKVLIDKSVTFDLGGHTVTADDDVFYIAENGLTVNFKNGNIVSTKYGGLFFKQGRQNEHITFDNCNITGVEGAIATSTLTGSTITINGGTFTSSNNAVILTNGNKRMYPYDETNTALRENPNTITINGGTFKGQMSDEAYNGRNSIACGIYAAWKDIIIVNDGTFEIERGVGVLCRGGKVTIKGGTFTTTDPDTKKGCVGDSRIVVPCQTVYVDKASQYPDYENATIEISGGSFSDVKADDYLEQTYTLNLSKGLYNVVKNRVYVGGKEYDTLQTAIEAATDGQTITFYNNVKTAAFEIPKEKNVVFAMNGKTVTVKGNKTGGGIIVNGNLTITGYRGLFGDPTGESVGYLFNINDGASVTIDTDNYVTFQCGLSCAQMQGNTAKLIINGGKWIGGEYNGKFWTLNKIDAYKESQIIIKGGKFYKFNPAESHTEDPAENWLADGYTAVQNGDWYEVITTIENNTRLIESALSTANSTAVINENVEVSCVSAAKNSTLQLENGATITGYGQVSGLARDVIMTSKGLDIKGKGKIVSKYANDTEKSQSTAIRVSGGTVNIYDGIEVDGGSGCHGNYAIRMLAGTVNILGGYFHSSPINDAESSEVIYLQPRSNTTVINLNIEGGVFESSGDASYLINCLDAYIKNCHIKITGGIFVGFDPSNSVADKINGKNANWVPDGYVSKEITYNGKQAWEVTKAE